MFWRELNLLHKGVMQDQHVSGYLQCLSISLTDLQQSSTSRLHLATTLLKAL